MSTSPLPWLKARANGYAPVEPTVSRRCRKTPVMKADINPNLAAHYPAAPGPCFDYDHPLRS